MTDTSAATPATPLGVGNIISQSFSILFGNFLKVVILGFAATFLGFLFNWLLINSFATANIGSATIIIGTILSVLVSLVIYGLVTALLVQLAYDAKLNRQRSLGSYFGPALAGTLPIAILSIAVGLMFGVIGLAWAGVSSVFEVGAISIVLGICAAILGFWIYAVFSVYAPAVVIEKAGFRALGRSTSLTKGYRWPIFGALLVMGIITALIQFVAGYVATQIAVALSGSPIVLGVITSLVSGVGYGLGGIAIALIYARLREIKEGVSVDAIAAVFD